MSRANEPANPCVRTEPVGTKRAYGLTIVTVHADVSHSGLTIREHFAALALQGILACPDSPGSMASAAKSAVCAAEALIAELAKVQP